jgi:cytochrome b subunit of formate dehydrogenase
LPSILPKKFPIKIMLKLPVKCGATHRLKIWMLAGLFSITGWSVTPALAEDAASAKLDNATCLSCHDGHKGTIEVEGADDNKRALFNVVPEKFSKGVHANMQCVSCHTEITDAKAQHEKAPNAKKPDCIQCHEALWDKAKQNNLTRQEARLGVVVQNINAYKQSFHARPNKDEPEKANATCNDCHNVHTFDIAPEGTVRREEHRLEIPNLCGKSCHTDELEDYSESIHGKQVLEKENVKAAVCSDCHTTHSIGNTSATQTKLTITTNCGNCHADRLESYRKTYHGQINALGFANTGKCFDCHGSHTIQPEDNPESSVYKDNVLKTCQQCHNPKKGVRLATAGFATFAPHGTANNFSKYPAIWLAAKFMTCLLVGTFIFFWAHTLLWFYREYKDRKDRKLRPHVRMEALPPQYQGKHYQRFAIGWRILHLCFVLATMTLATTGLPLFFPSTPWAVAVINFFGGPQTAGIVHRTAASVFLGVFIIHLVVVVYRIGRDWKNFKFFGPHSMIPNWQDMKDIVGMFKWFLGLGEKPLFERWTYWEKFDYWAPFWGVTIIGASGLMMWFPHVTATFLPGWVFNVAIIFHSEEAVLAILFLFTVHFFNNHFRPEKFPIDTVMFTGAFTVEEFRREHRVEYERLVRTGELEKYLVNEPSRPMKIGSKILGFTLIVIGLTLLALTVLGLLGV